jgi:hypothetical protein
MIQQYHNWRHASKQHQFCMSFGFNVPNFLPMPAPKAALLGTDGDSGADFTLHHHSSDPYGGHGMIQQHHIW